MGKLFERSGLTLALKTPEGTCPMCATKHDPWQPHNQQSLTYQYVFYDETGRWPTWADAMAHCPEDVKRAWIIALSEMGASIK